jgi:hypothetical protein
VSAARSASARAGRNLGALLVVGLMLLAALSLWTAIPLAWVYIGSKLSETQFASGGPYMVVFFGIVISILVIAWLLSRLNGLYVALTGTNTINPIRPVWLRSMRDTPAARAPTVLEVVMVASVVLAMVAMGLWFFILAGSPLPNQ